MRHSYSDRIRKLTQKQNSGVGMETSSKKLMDHLTKRKGLKMRKGLHLRIKEEAVERTEDSKGEQLREKRDEDRECNIR